MRALIAAALCVSVAALVAVSEPHLADAQDKKDDKKAKAKVDPKTFIPDDATKKAIADKTAELRKAVEALEKKLAAGAFIEVWQKQSAADVLVEVEIYLKAAENIVRFEEWLHKDSVKWTLTTLDQGMRRAKEAEGGGAVWRDAPGKWVVRAYRSKVDGSIQPYAVLLPPDFGQDPKKKWRLDIVLHGRDGALTEAKFIAGHQGTAPKDLGYIQLEVYGRGNNAYRWAGETDVFEAREAFEKDTGYPLDLARAVHPIDPHRVVLRGFSMGGAGAWHIGLRNPSAFCVIGPGAGFTTTHGYIAGLPKELADHQEKCLRIYDAYLYAENAFNVPVVAYSGEKDAQKKAADNIANALKGFKEEVKFTHLVAPGLEHQMPKEWQDKAEAEYRKYADKGRAARERVRYVTYTPKNGQAGWIDVVALEKQYERAVVDATPGDKGDTILTTNVRRLRVRWDGADKPRDITLDGQALAGVRALPASFAVLGNGVAVVEFHKQNGRWTQATDGALNDPLNKPLKRVGLCGPIDAAFAERFVVVGPTGDGGYPAAALKQFANLWDRYFRGAIPALKAAEYNPEKNGPEVSPHLVLFGDPQSNPLIAKVLPKLPITWTKEKLVVNGVEYDPKTHVPVLIYPNPLNGNKSYVVINSGHTFGEADLKGTNALLYPRLGDWAVIKPTPTAKDPAAYEVVAAGLFDENWLFAKKK